MSTQETIHFISRQIHIYFGLSILILGVFGGILNVIIFTTLKTFRETISGFYLTILAIVNIGQLIIALFIRVLTEGFYIDIRSTSVGCKIQMYAAAWCQLVSMTIICLATVDQYVSMSVYRHYSNKRLAQRATIFTCILWAIYCISLGINYDAPSGICKIINPSFVMYVTRFHFPVLLGFLPLSTMTIFSILAFNSARTLVSRQINIVRLSRDRQLTAMTLVHALFFVIVTLPFIIFFIYVLNQSSKDSEQTARNNLTFSIIILIDYLGFGSSFYIYCCVSERFRKQLLYVLMRTCINRRQVIHRWTNNQVVPNIVIIVDNQPAITNRVAVEVVSIE